MSPSISLEAAMQPFVLLQVRASKLLYGEVVDDSFLFGEVEAEFHNWPAIALEGIGIASLVDLVERILRAAVALGLNNIDVPLRHSGECEWRRRGPRFDFR